MNIEQLRTQQQTEVTDLLSTLKTVEINPVDICNRSCSFCPRSDTELYPNTKGTISLELITKIAKDLKAINYSNRVSFVGFGEPLLYKSLVDAVGILSAELSLCRWIEVNTNADFLTKDLAEQLSKAGCTNITVSMYDSNITHQLLEKLKGVDIQLTFKHCYRENFEITLVNRSDIISQNETVSVAGQCFLPFYKMFIDWNGDVLLCCNDWGRKGIIGNLNSASVEELWFSEKLNTHRRALRDGKRINQNPCKYCDIQGTRYGQESFDLLTKHI
jgi:radical SAM protein with 4Fe4S-binding SPASM domain